MADIMDKTGGIVEWYVKDGKSLNFVVDIWP